MVSARDRQSEPPNWPKPCPVCAPAAGFRMDANSPKDRQSPVGPGNPCAHQIIVLEGCVGSIFKGVDGQVRSLDQMGTQLFLNRLGLLGNRFTGTELFLFPLECKGRLADAVKTGL